MCPQDLIYSELIKYQIIFKHQSQMQFKVKELVKFRSFGPIKNLEMTRSLLHWFNFFPTKYCLINSFDVTYSKSPHQFPLFHLKIWRESYLTIGKLRKGKTKKKLTDATDTCQVFIPSS